MAHAKSFRTSSAAELIQWHTADAGRSAQQRLARVEGTVSSSDGTRTIECLIEPKKKRALVNGKPVEQASSFYGQFVAVVFTPDELQLVKGSPSVRRKFFDRILVMSDRSYVDAVVQYQRALKHRNAVLQTGRERKTQVETQLAAWDELLAVHAVEIVRRRTMLLGKLQATTGEYYKILAQQGPDEAESESISLSYRSQFTPDEGEITQESVKRVLNEHLAADLRRGMTTSGPHRDDVDFKLHRKGVAHHARSAASQGQARSMALAVTLAAISYLKEEIGESPVVLLDDVESELDSARRASLHSLLGGFQSQVLITATEASRELSNSLRNYQTLILSEGLASAQKPPKNQS